MKVKNVYQDDEGNWHIDYGFTHLMGLAIRVQLGGLFLSLTIMLAMALTTIVLGTICMAFIGLSGFEIDNSRPKKDNTSSSHNLQRESVLYRKNSDPKSSVKIIFE